MKSNKRFGMASVALLLGVVGCASPSYNQGDSTSQAAKATAAETGTTQATLDSAMAALRDLVGTKEGDLKGKFDVFSGAFDKLSDSVKAMQRKVDDVTARATAHLDKWEKDLAEVKSEDIKASSKNRKAAIEARVTKIKELAASAKTQAGPLLDSLGDIRKILGTDLTQGGVATVRSAAEKVEPDAKKLRETAVQFGVELEALSAELSTGTPVAEPAKK